MKRNKSEKAKRKNLNFSRNRIDVKRIIDFEIRIKNASQIQSIIMNNELTIYMIKYQQFTSK